MKKALLLVCVAGMSSVAIADTKYSGFRMGAGATMGQATEIGNLGAQPRLELGYDVNRIFSINGYVQGLKGKTNGEYAYDLAEPYMGQVLPPVVGAAEAEVNGWRAGIEAEVGYAFDLGAIDLKPYVAVGIATQGGDFKVSHISNTMPSDNIDTLGSETLESSAVTGAIGLRMNTALGIYVDTRVERAPFRNRGIMKDQTQGSVSVGYKF
ncbi:outer membrane beta-barrel protein [Vibrio hangzhouensis]|uniref:Outer membrane protein beta-barrel domain-containing protein n=1 Tax=Vibrio hangzhouensis TaxID=462991 RepID=A0A1H5VH74_9VIBR|nr:outer membrane beta-barrel protein [Vibrio hangzhouensis]SEF86158.1 Outer membrane protein beta-barrel domain-containing protein [Vibrio hangzhouensis]